MVMMLDMSSGEIERPVVQDDQPLPMVARLPGELALRLVPVSEAIDAERRFKRSVQPMQPPLWMLADD
ncbi:hypothetical protein [Parachitinimonas caeni]|uniref:Uncharacterized protein n=1 Tax=Parachitinimonas caeni TaxID=3031301 RepID=A0ABT7E0F9_9NEIS|nr:hypothetical protein [Parachitinimonas caeni]MDK2125794.1 hypothetical protein [Parachitinimonas caeni]